MKNFIKYKNKKYELNEPTIKNWSEAMKFKDILEPDELYIKMIEVMTGLSKEEINEISVAEISKVGSTLYHYLNQENKELSHRVILDGVVYKLVDISKISFGQFVDIDTFLKKEEAYRIANLNELAAYLYCEEGLDYSQSDFAKRIEIMKNLPVKYIESSLFFLSSLEKGLQNLTLHSSKNKLMWEIMRLRTALGVFGDGMRSLVTLPKTKFGKLMGLLLSPLYLVSIICLTLWTLIVKKKNK
jgi:hypothetical protein